MEVQVIWILSTRGLYQHPSCSVLVISLVGNIHITCSDMCYLFDDTELTIATGRLKD